MAPYEPSMVRGSQKLSSRAIANAGAYRKRETTLANQPQLRTCLKSKTMINISHHWMAVIPRTLLDPPSIQEAPGLPNRAKG